MSSNKLNDETSVKVDLTYEIQSIPYVKKPDQTEMMATANFRMTLLLFSEGVV